MPLDELIEDAAAKSVGANSLSDFIEPLRVEDVAGDVSNLNQTATHLLHHPGTVGDRALMHNKN